MITPPDEGSEEASQPIIPEIDQATYRELYRLADWMFQTKPWERMYDFHTFVLQDPETDIAQLACVMGNARSVFALHLYQPEEGIRWRTRVGIEGSSPLSAHDAQFDNRYLSVEFVEEVEMDDHDEMLDEAFAPEEWFDDSETDPYAINSLLLRSVLPGCPPWHPSEDEAQRMIDGLRLLRRYYEDYFEEYEWATYSPEPDEPIKLPTFQLPKNAKRSDPAAWKFSLSDFQPPGPKQLPEIPTDDLFLARLSKLKTKPGTRWELGALFSPKPILSEGRPAYPVIAFIGVTETNRAEGTSTITAQEPRASVLRQSFSKTAEALGYLPAELVVGSPIAELALAEIAKASGMKILGGGHPMPLFEDIANDMRQSSLFQMDDDEMPDFDLDHVTPESLAELDDLLRQAPGKDASEAELTAFMEQLMSGGTSAALLKPLLEKMASGALIDEPGIIAGDFGKKAPATLKYRPPSNPDRYIFRIDLVGAKPPIWRRISVPVDATFFDLHLAIQAAFGWKGYHLHSFEKRFNNRTELVISWKQDEAPIFGWPQEHALELKTPLNHFFRPGTETINYIYDYGDYWDHRIKLEKVVGTPPSKEVPLLEILKGKGANPIEDSGGIHAHMAILSGDNEFMEGFPADLIRKVQEDRFDPADAQLRDPQAEMEMLEERSR